MSTMKKGFPANKEGDYLIWSADAPLPRFVRIIKETGHHLCDFMWGDGYVYYDQIVAMIRGFDIDLGYQLYPDKWGETHYVEIPRPGLIDIVIGSPTKAGRYYLYSAQSVRNALDNIKNSFDLAPLGAYTEILDYHGQLAAFMANQPKPLQFAVSEDDEKQYFHYPIEVSLE